MIPDIILNKIYWYLWKYRQHKICREYHKYFMYCDLVNEVLYSSTGYFLVSPIYNINYRPYHDYGYDTLYRNFKHGKWYYGLPKNYFTQPIMY